MLVRHQIYYYDDWYAGEMPQIQSNSTISIGGTIVEALLLSL